MKIRSLPALAMGALSTFAISPASANAEPISVICADAPIPAACGISVELVEAAWPYIEASPDISVSQEGLQQAIEMDFLEMADALARPEVIEALPERTRDLLMGASADEALGMLKENYAWEMGGIIRSRTPGSLAAMFFEAGIYLTPDSMIETFITGKYWTFGDAQERSEFAPEATFPFGFRSHMTTFLAGSAQEHVESHMLANQHNVTSTQVRGQLKGAVIQAGATIFSSDSAQEKAIKASKETELRNISISLLGSIQREQSHRDNALNEAVKASIKLEKATEYRRLATEARSEGKHEEARSYEAKAAEANAEAAEHQAEAEHQTRKADAEQAVQAEYREQARQLNNDLKEMCNGPDCNELNLDELNPLTRGDYESLLRLTFVTVSGCEEEHLDGVCIPIKDPEARMATFQCANAIYIEPDEALDCSSVPLGEYINGGPLTNPSHTDPPLDEPITPEPGTLQ